MRVLVTGGNGQLGHAVRALAEERGVAKDFDFCDIDTFDMSDPEAYSKYDWSLYGTVINCGAYTAVDRAETPEGRVIAWKANATGPALLARTCAGHGITLVHVSSTAPPRSIPRTSPSARFPSTARPRRPATSPWPAARATTSCAAPGSSARDTTS